jgi:5-methyltetrahydrofolate--homocysteine methyltransferase
VGRIGRDQVSDYAARQAVSTAEAERRLRPNLAYEPAEDEDHVKAVSASSGT